MKQILVIAGGDVQAVGYRECVRKATFRKNIFGYVKNLESGEVEILAEGDEEELKAFLNAIHISEYPIDVREFQVTWQDATGKFDKFVIVRGDKDQELFERIDVAGSLLYRVVENTSLSLVKQDQMLEKQDQLLGKQDQMLEKQDKMLVKQDQMLGKQDQLLDKQDQMLGKQDQLLGKQDQMISLHHETVDEIKGLRKDSANFLETEFSEIKKRLHSIENALNEMGINV